MEDGATIKPLREQFHICIKYFHSDQGANSQLNLTKCFENFGTNLLFLKFCKNKS